MDVKRTTPRNIIIEIPKVKDKEKTLKAPREKQLVTYKGVPITLSADFSKGTLQARSIQSDAKQSTTQITMSSKASI